MRNLLECPFYKVAHNSDTLCFQAWTGNGTDAKFNKVRTKYVNVLEVAERINQVQPPLIKTNPRLQIYTD